MRNIMWFGFVLGALSAAGNVIHTKSGERAKIACGAGTIRKEVQWMRGNDLIMSRNVKTGSGRKGRIPIFFRSKLIQDRDLEISKVEEADAGLLTCFADGTPHHHTLLVVTVSVSPSADLQLGGEATLQCQVKGPDPEFTVEWEKPDGGSGVPSPVHLNPVANTDAGTWRCKFSWHGEPYEETLDVKVKEPEPTSRLPPSSSPQDIITPTCPKCRPRAKGPQPDKSGWLGLSLWMWVAVGVGCLVLVLLIISIIVVHQRIKRRRRKAQKLKSIRQPLRAKNYCQCNGPAATAAPPRGRQREKPSSLPRQQR
ncbi:leukocyte immunoglobulin-like receptor subfamily B member 1 [Centroberyx affinis]|uniref:leukocyte immunoglobulin-like receptor subfamily B member 1 n=1 Tax=Centroberyx affinis TaxID=166261 RepID=UPI003A5C5D46